MQDRRRYERYVLMHANDEKANIKVVVEDEFVHLVDFSLSGLSFLSNRHFPKSEMVNLSIDLENKGKLNLIGIVVRTTREPNSERWSISVDLSHSYNINTIHKV